MLSDLFGYFRDILAGKLRSSQLVVLFCALASTGFTYFYIRDGKWFQSVRTDFGSIGPLLLLTVGFLLFLILFQIFSRCFERISIAIRSASSHSENRERVVNVFSRLSDWQKGFLVLAVRENKRQWHSYEIPGGYAAIWEPEIDVLVQKRVVRCGRHGVYLIDDNFFDILQEVYHAEQQSKT